MSLLARFFNQIKSSQEDIASEGLKYILQNSDLAKDIIVNQINSKTAIQLPELSYVSQISKTDLGRTDISGIDFKGNEVIIFEAKFWASLTENQPTSYLKRLTGDSVLLFICPSLRKNSLYIELTKKLNDQNLKFNSDENLLKFKIIDTNQFILIQSWTELLEPIRTILKSNNQDKLLSDIDQIIGFCDVIDKNSFIPLNDKDLSPEIGRKVNSYYELMNEIISELSKSEYYKQGKLTEGKPSKEFGSYKYRIYDGHTITFGLNFGYWSKFADTPFWLIISESNWKQSGEFKFKLKKAAARISMPTFENDSNNIILPIYPKRYEDKNSVIKNMVEQIDQVFSELRN